MRRLCWLPLICMAVVAPCQLPSGQPNLQTNGLPNYKPYPLDTLESDGPAAIQVMAIVRAENHREESRPSYHQVFDRTPNDRPQWVSIEHVTVLTGIGIKPRSEVDFVAPQKSPERPLGFSGIWYDPRPALVAGKVYLVLGLYAADGRLPLPITMRGPQSLVDGWSVKATDPNELTLLTAFRTDASAFPPSNSAKDRIIKSLIDALPATSSDWDFDRLLNLIWQARRPPISERQEAEYVGKVRRLADTTTNAHVRFYARALLADWHAPAARAPFIASLLEVADDPSFIVSDIALPNNVTDFTRTDDPEYPLRFDRARANYLAAASQNEGLRHYLFERIASPKTVEEWTRFVKNLDTESPYFVDHSMLEKFAQWAGQVKDKSPIIKPLPGKPIPMATNHDELVAYWKSMYP